MQKHNRQTCEALRKLKFQISGIEELRGGVPFDSGHTAWELNTRLHLQNIFGAHSMLVRRFDEIQWERSFTMIERSDRFDQAVELQRHLNFLSALGQAKGILSSCIQLLEEHGLKGARAYQGGYVPLSKRAYAWASRQCKWLRPILEAVLTLVRGKPS